jgi:quinol monooxygenase YgiN
MSAEPPFYTASYVEVAAALADAAAALRRPYLASVVGYMERVEVLQGVARPEHLIVLAAWRDQQTFESYTATEGCARLSEELGALLVAPIDTRQHWGLATAPARGSGTDSLMVVTHVDVVPAFKDDCVLALVRLAADSRRHEGNLRLDVWQQTNRPNHFTVVESWADREAFDAHGAAPETKDFRAHLAEMTGALYDERLYRLLDQE